MALIGESGAGKSTLLRIIMGFISPSLGEIYINGQSAFSNQEIIHKTISYLPSEFTLFDFPKGSDFINLCAKLNNSSNKNALSLIKDFDLDVNANPKRMSKGMKQKTAIISTFMNDRDVYLLDEPSTGLDPLMREKLYNQILKLKDNSKTIIFTTNSYDEAMRLADKVLIISNGKILKTININDIKVSIPVNAIDWGHTLFEKGGAFYNVFTNWIDNASGRYSFTWDKPRERKERIKIANGVKEWLQKLADEGMASYPESHLTVMVQAMKSQACDIGIDLFDKNQLFATTFKQS